MQITLRRPDDWHIHLRDGALLRRTVPDAARQFARAIVMPNLVPPVTTVVQLRKYHSAIMAEVPKDNSFTPLMTLYLTEDLTVETLTQARREGLLTAVKYYPQHGTTNAAHGVRDLLAQGAVLNWLEREQVPLLLHGEVVSEDVDIFDRERIFVDGLLQTLRHRYQGLKIVLEHISTKEAAAYVEQSSPGIAATITAHHLLFNRNAMLAGGIKPHFYCLPILKSEQDRLALLAAIRSGSERFFLGTDSAPHSQERKECSCGAAGIYTAHVALELYATAFEQADCLGKLEGFAAIHGPMFYGLPLNESWVTLRKVKWQPAPQLDFGNSAVVSPLNSVEWQLVL